ncbi:hypothetical protein RK21_01028 [Pseudomonas plecoglossicida]|nr:hypothetical protein RK21_01028 [Pseudomonas plecoglossicida]
MSEHPARACECYCSMRVLRGLIWLMLRSGCMYQSVHYSGIWLWRGNRFKC